MERGTMRRQQSSSCQECACRREKGQARSVNKKELSNVAEREEEEGAVHERESNGAYTVSSNADTKRNLKMAAGGFSLRCSPPCV